MQVGDERIDLAQIFAASFFRLHLPFADHRGQVTQLVQAFPGQFLAALAHGERGQTLGELDLKARGVDADRLSQLRTQLYQLRLQMSLWRCAGSETGSVLQCFHISGKAASGAGKKARRRLSPDGLSIVNLTKEVSLLT